MEGDAAEEAGIGHCRDVGGVPGNDAHNIRLLESQTTQIAGNALGVQEQLLTCEDRILRSGNLKCKN